MASGLKNLGGFLSFFSLTLRNHDPSKMGYFEDLYKIHPLAQVQTSSFFEGLRILRAVKVFDQTSLVGIGIGTEVGLF